MSITYTVSAMVGGQRWIWRNMGTEDVAKERAESIGRTGFWIKRNRGGARFVPPSQIGLIVMRRIVKEDRRK